MKKSHYYRTSRGLLAVIVGLYSCVTAATENNLTKQWLVSQAEQFVLDTLNPDNNKNIDVSVMPIDSRVKIPHCSSDIKFSSTSEALSQSNITVKAVCTENDWYMFLVVKSVETQSVVVLSSAVSPGTLLTKDNLEVVSMDKKRLRSTTFANIDQVLGARIKRRLTSGRPVESSNLCYVCKGDTVVISADSSGMKVKTSGIALEDGNMGETIQVKNRRSNKKIYAKVASTGRVEVNI
jgi:flagella basal body P-ring formation protein FlgA